MVKVRLFFEFFFRVDSPVDYLCRQFLFRRFDCGHNGLSARFSITLCFKLLSRIEQPVVIKEPIVIDVHYEN